MNIRVDRPKLVCAIVGAGLLAGCASITPLPFPPGNPAGATIRVPVRTPDNLLAHDETTVAIEGELSQTASNAKSAERGMQHGEMQMEDQQAKPTDVEAEKKVLADEMKKTADEMKRTSDAMKRQSAKQRPKKKGTPPE